MSAEFLVLYDTLASIFPPKLSDLFHLNLTPMLKIKPNSHFICQTSNYKNVNISPWKQQVMTIYLAGCLGNVLISFQMSSNTSSTFPWSKQLSLCASRWPSLSLCRRNHLCSAWMTTGLLQSHLSLVCYCTLRFTYRHQALYTVELVFAASNAAILVLLNYKIATVHVYIYSPCSFISLLF